MSIGFWPVIRKWVCTINWRSQWQCRAQGVLRDKGRGRKRKTLLPPYSMGTLQQLYLPLLPPVGPWLPPSPGKYQDKIKFLLHKTGIRPTKAIWNKIFCDYLSITLCSVHKHQSLRPSTAAASAVAHLQGCPLQGRKENLWSLSDFQSRLLSPNLRIVTVGWKSNIPAHVGREAGTSHSHKSFWSRSAHALE